MTNLKKMLTAPLIVTITANMMGSLQYGYNIGLPSNIQKVLEEFMNRTISERNGEAPSEHLITNLWAITAAVIYLGGAVGAAINRCLARQLTRRCAFLINILVGLVGVALESASRRTELWELLLVGRLIIGVHMGIYAMLVPMYLSEISRTEVRGAVTNLTAFGMTLSVVFGMVAGFPNALGTPELWDLMFGLAIVPIAIQLLLLPFCVESPRYLMITKKDTEAARRALQRLRGSQDVEDEIKAMQEEMENVTETVTIVELFKHAPTRRALVIAVLSQMSQKMCGSNGVLYYSNNIFQESLGLSSQVAAYLIAVLGFTCFIMCFVATPLTEKAGRRTLQLTGLIGMAGSTLAITICLAMRQFVDGFDIAAIVFVVIFVVFLGIGPICIPWVLIGELFAQNTKPVASSMAVTSNWLSGFLVTYAFSPLERLLTDYVFLPFGVLTALIAVYTYHNLPETKGKTQQEIMVSFERPGDFSTKDFAKSQKQIVASIEKPGDFSTHEKIREENGGSDIMKANEFNTRF